MATAGSSFLAHRLPPGETVKRQPPVQNRYHGEKKHGFFMGFHSVLMGLYSYLMELYSDYDGIMGFTLITP